ncbi:MAG: diversity-generating retroelement protein Avd [Thiomargarita sp.]|nr:diversity-generating retroelement protein Avd [Thiomargarita sp.]
MTIKNNDLPIFTQWLTFLEWLLPITEGFPKRVRFTFADRINNLALDIVEDLIEARYTSKKLTIFRQANLRLEKLRILLRLAHTMRYLDFKRYEYAMKSINDIGKMLGGWARKQQE